MRVLGRVVVFTLGLIVAGCGDRGDGELCELPSAETTLYFPQSIEQDVDILVVLDTSPAMSLVWSSWMVQAISPWSRVVEALRTPKLNNKLWDLRIGVVSADLGAGSYTTVPGCKPGGDGAKLQRGAAAGCAMPKDPWISYTGGATNIDNPQVADPVEQVKKALDCMIDLGAAGCGFSQPLEAARRALDPKLGLNPGFLRQEALLYLLFVTAGDDCSAAKTQLYDPSQTGTLGPLSTHRCFELGVQCSCPAGPCTRTTTGLRKDCRPTGTWLHKIEDYASFFKGLKPPGRVMVSVVSGPVDRVDVQLVGGEPTLAPSCQTSQGTGKPAIRLEAFTRALGSASHKAYFNRGTDATSTQDIDVTICSPSLAPAVRVLHKLIVAADGGQCVTGPVLTQDCGLACAKGVALGSGSAGSCDRSCLHRADCTAQQLWSQDLGKPPAALPRCPAALFDNAKERDCGDSCPCWRIVPSARCDPAVDGSPYDFQLLRKGTAPKYSVAKLTCATSVHKWGSEGALAIPLCAPAP